MTSVLVVAPHPDDETLGCGGTLLRHKADGDRIHWLIMTHVSEAAGFTPERVRDRNAEISMVADRYGFASVHNLAYAPASLDRVPLAELIPRVGAVFAEVRPEVVYMPNRADIHTDHRVCFDAAASCTKWFRNPYVRRVLAYETLSETDCAIDPDRRGFIPNAYVDVTAFLDRKIEIAHLYTGEMGDYPFPRSDEAIRSLASFRGVSCGCGSAEAFMLLKEIR